MRLKMINVSEFKGNGQPKLKYERHGTGWIKLRKVKPQISGFPQQELFKETQRLPRFLFFAMCSGTIIFGIVILVLRINGAVDVQTVRVLWLAWVLVALTDWAMASIQMVTEIHPDGILVYCKPFRFLKRKLQWDAIDRMYARTYSPLADYGGWGIRRGKSGLAYNMRGHQGVQLELKDSQNVLIGTQTPQAFIDAARSAGGPVTQA